MGNAPCKPSSTPSSNSTPLLRYTTTIYPYGGGKTTKEYTYISTIYKVEIHPRGIRACSIKPYDQSFWSKITEKPETIYVASSFLEEAAEFLKKKEEIENKIQSKLAVN
jgi:hypothetical protein